MKQGGRGGESRGSKGGKRRFVLIFYPFFGLKTITSYLHPSYRFSR